ELPDVAEDAGDLVAAGPSGGIPPQESHTQCLQVVGDLTDQAARRRRVRRELPGQGGPGPRRRAREGLVEEAAERVPITSRGELAIRELLGSEVGGGPDDQPFAPAAGSAVAQLADQPEIEDDHASALLHEHVGGLQIAVDAAHLVEGADASGQLNEPVAQPRAREAGPADRRRWLLLEERRPTHPRSEEHTSELQSRENLVCRLLLEKKKT